MTYLSVAIIAVRSLIGFNTNLIGMITDEFKDSCDFLDIEELKEIDCIFNLLDFINDLNININITIFSSPERYLYYFDDLCFSVENTKRFKIYNNNKYNLADLLQKNEIFSLLQ